MTDPFQWGPQGLEFAAKYIMGGMSPVIMQNFSTDPMGRILSMTYQGPTYGGELYFHYDVQGNTSLLTDSNGQPVASFRYDLHSGQIAEYWNPSNLEIMNMKGGSRGSVTLTSNIGYLPDWKRDLMVRPRIPLVARNDWGFINVRPDSTEPGDDDEDDEKDCGDDDACTLEDCEKLFKNEYSSETKYNDYEADEYNCKLIICCGGAYYSSAINFPYPHTDDHIEVNDLHDNSRVMHIELFQNRRGVLLDWWKNNKDDCLDKFGIDIKDYVWGPPGPQF